jgi:acetolactate synthase-1/2/3 large subunit
MKASDLFVRCLEQEGIEYIFGVPGEENADFVLSLENSESIRFVLTRHEQGAAFMADVYGRLTGSPAGCLGTLGPGSTNLMTGVANANMDRSPVLVLTGQGSTLRQHKESHQMMDVVSMFEPVTKWTTSILQPDTIPEIVRKAVRLARSEKPGAVHIELAEDIAKEEAVTRPLPVHRYRRAEASGEAVSQATSMLLEARRPIIIAGNGSVRTRASASLRALCELTGIGVVSTFMAKGAVDMDAPYSLFTVGLSQKDIVSQALDEADLVLTLGLDIVEYPPENWNSGHDGDRRDRPIVHADFIPAEIDSFLHPEVELVGDLAATLDALTAGISNAGVPDYDLEGQKEVRRAMLEELHRHDDDETTDSIRPQKMLSDLRQVLGPDDIVLSDVGAHKMWIARHYHCNQPNTCLIPNGFCSMGFALPGAIAAALVHPERNIVAVAGDGGFLMNVQEMETASRLGVPITVVVWEDNAYGLIAWKQDDEFGHHSELSFTNPRWEELATSFGWSSYRASESTSLRGVLQTAVEDRKPTLVVIPIDYRENELLTKRLGRIECRI